jgi:cytochrome c biogenesis protein CcmG, thiol:disulfide interchange protein DsbE
LVFLALSLALWWGLGQDPKRLPSALINQPMPVLQGHWLSDGRALQAQDIPHQPWLLHVWATWCASCQDEQPAWQQIKQHYQVVVLGLNYKDQRQQALSWLDHYHQPYRDSVMDPAGDIAMAWGVYGTPETFLIDAHGIIKAKYIGPVTMQQWQQEIWPAMVALRGDA